MNTNALGQRMKKAEFYREANPTSHGPLEGLVVLEACTTYAGPVAAAELADLGAEVIKCELPGTGDVCRLFGPRVPNAPTQDCSKRHVLRKTEQEHLCR